MGCGLSTAKDSKLFPEAKEQKPDLLPAQKKSVPSQDGLYANAQVLLKRSTTNGSNQDFKLQVFSEAPPKYDAVPETLPVEFNSFPPGVIVILNLLKKAAKLNFWGHKGAWGSLNSRHGQIWLDSAYTLRPITRVAILLHATILLLVGKALRSNMTFYFTTFPNLETEQLSVADLETLKALMEVFNAETFLQATTLIGQHKTALSKQDLESFLRNEHSFLETDTTDEKLVKLLGFTREKIKGLWHGWESRKLTFQKLRSLYKSAQKASEKQPKLLNNTSFIYQMAVNSYKRQLKSNSIYPLTCTFLLGTRLEPAEVDAIQQCQLEGRKVAKETKGSLWGRYTQPESDSVVENAGSAAKELEKEGSQFSIEAIVFCDQLNDQAKKLYNKVDDFLEGQTDDINDVTFVSEVRFLLHFLSDIWIFKTTTSHDYRVDNWVELRNTAQYNDESIVDMNGVIWLPSDDLIRWFVFDIVDNDDDDDDDEEQLSNHRSRDPQTDEINLANHVKLGIVPNAGSQAGGPGGGSTFETVKVSEAS